MYKGPPSFDPFAHTRFVIHEPRLLDEHRRKRRALESAADDLRALAPRFPGDTPDDVEARIRKFQAARDAGCPTWETEAQRRDRLAAQHTPDPPKPIA